MFSLEYGYRHVKLGQGQPMFTAYVNEFLYSLVFYLDKSSRKLALCSSCHKPYQTWSWSTQVLGSIPPSSKVLLTFSLRKSLVNVWSPDSECTAK